MIKHVKGYIFNTKCDYIVNTVNCEGFMGKGIALEFKLRYPNMYRSYQNDCAIGDVRVGEIKTYTDRGTNIINFPTKDSYKLPSKPEYIEQGLVNFVKISKSLKIKSIAFPLLGSHNGGLSKDLVLKMMINHLSNVDFLVEIYEFDKNTTEIQLEKVKKEFNSSPSSVIKSKYKLSDKQIESIYKALNTDSVKRLSDLLGFKSIGQTTIAKIYEHIELKSYGQQELF